MFTGIIEELGRIASIKNSGNFSDIIISAEKVLEDAKLGDSIAVNGVCLTVSKLNKNSFEANVMGETLRRSGLGDLTAGSVVNLERAMLVNSRFGGHIVAGHIDGTGNITSMNKEGNSIWISISAPPGILRYIVEKGSITIDGISLTVAYVDDKLFKVSIIPHTMQNTNLLNKKSGDKVNLENDIIGKYVEKLMMPKETLESSKSNIDLKFLSANGFL